jgi:LuxR family quorum sensing-dependent transcriptional regulator
MNQPSPFEFVESLRYVSTTDDLVRGMTRTLNCMDIEYFCLNLFPRPDQGFEEVMLASRLPPDWLALYVHKQFVHDDPSIRHCKRATMPFAWHDAPYDPEREPRSAEVVERATDFGLSRGILVPVPSAGGCIGDVWLGGSPSEKALPAIHLMCLYAFYHLQHLKARPPVKSHSLSPRQREILTWVAAGKSSWEIGEILNISQRTVEWHVRQIMLELNVKSRAQAVALALREGTVTV